MLRLSRRIQRRKEHLEIFRNSTRNGIERGAMGIHHRKGTLARRILRTNDTEYEEVFEKDSWTIFYGLRVITNTLSGNRNDDK
jgi:hypothetical protein